MTDIVVPFTGPLFFTDAAFGAGVGVGAWAGPSPYVDTFDTSTSYGTATPSTGLIYGCGAAYTWAPSTAVTALTMLCQVRPHYGTTSGSFSQTRLWMADAVGGSFWIDSLFTVPDNTWQTLSIDLVVESGATLATLLSLFAGNVYLGAACYDGASVDVSAVQLVATVPGPDLTGALLDDRVRFT